MSIIIRLLLPFRGCTLNTRPVSVVNVIIEMILIIFVFLGEQGVVIGILNSGVHIIMYFYYLVAAMGPQYQKFLWWKKYMTSIQLIQFVLIMIYMVTIALKGCNMPKTLTFFFIANTLVFLYLFGNFYRKTYRDSKAHHKATKAALRAASGLGCVPTKSFLDQGDQMKRLIDANNNNNCFKINEMKLE